MTQPQAEMLDLYRAGLKTAADLLKTSLENAERLQNQQLVAIRTAIVEQSKTASELGSARTLDELLSAQSRLAGMQIERALGYWSELCQVAGQNQMAAIGQVQQQMSRMSESLAQAVTTTAGAAGIKQPEGKKQESRKSA
jgi:phasin family protein